MDVFGLTLRYLVLSADYFELSLQDEQTGPARIDELGLPTPLVEELRHWNGRYQPVIPRDIAERSSNALSMLIGSLDQEGLTFADRIADALGGRAKVRYCSEGLLRYLL